MYFIKKLLYYESYVRNHAEGLQGENGKMLKSLLENPIYYGIVGLGKILPDTTAANKMYLKMLFHNRMGKKLNLKNPATYNEKLQWMKLYLRNPEYTTLVDKEAVKQIVAERVGWGYIIPTLGVWKRFEEIDFDKLPDQFVLKCNHDSGGLVICKDKSTLDLERANQKICHCMKRNYYSYSREWPYQNVPRKILAEQYISNSDGSVPEDYKFFCFNGEPDCVMVCVGRESGHTKFFFYDMNWNRRLYQKPGIEPDENITIEKPENFEAMIEVARKLAKGYPEVRVDLYNVDGKIYFGEYTFFNQSGFDSDISLETDLYWGKQFRLEQSKS